MAFDNRMMFAGLNLMGGGGFQGAAQGLAQGALMDERAAEAEQRRIQQEQMAEFFRLAGQPAGGGAGTPAGGPTIAPQPQPVPVTTQPLPPQGPGAPIPLVPPGMMAGGGGNPAAMGQAQAYGGVPPSAALKRRFGSAKAGANYGMGAGSATGNPMASASRASAPGAPVGYGRQETRLGGDYWREFGGARPPVAPSGGVPGPAGVQVSPLGPIPTGGAPMAPTPVSAAQRGATGRQQALGASPGAGFGLMDMIRGMDPATRGLLAAMPAEQSLPLMFGMLNQRNQPGKITETQKRQNLARAAGLKENSEEWNAFMLRGTPEPEPKETGSASRIGKIQDDIAKLPPGDPRRAPLMAQIEKLNEEDASLVTLNNKAETEWDKQDAIRQNKQLSDYEGTASDAIDILRANNSARRLLDEGIFGPNADARVGLARFGQLLGFSDPSTDEAIAATEAYLASRSQAVANIAKQFGSGAGITEADREFAADAAAGRIDLTVGGIKRILDLSDKAADIGLQKYKEFTDYLTERRPHTAGSYRTLEAPVFDDAPLPPGFKEVQ